jgi:putative peptidoglycan lipid II flippase
MRTAGRVAGWTFAAIMVQQLGFVVLSRVTTAAQPLAEQAGATISSGKVVYDNAFLLFMLPHSLVAVSLVTALFTRMSVAAADGRIDAVRDDHSLGLRITGLATVLATAAFLALGPDLIAVLFPGNGEADTRGLAYVTMGMMLGLVPFSAQYLFQRVFYAFEDARTPFTVQVPIVATWASGNVLSLLFLPPAWIVVGVGASMTIANTLGAALSAVLLHRRLGRLDGRRVLRTYVRLGLAAALAGPAGFGIARLAHLLVGQPRPAALLAAVVGGAGMIGVYGLALNRMRVTELGDALRPLLRRRG